MGIVRFAAALNPYYLRISLTMKRELVFVNLLSKNPEKLIEFYTKIVGLNPIDTKADPACEHWYGFDTGKTPFAIEPMSNRDKYQFDYNKSNPVLIQFKANSLEDLKQWTERLEKKRVTIGQGLMKKSYGTVTTFVDPDGNCIELIYTEQ